MVTVASTATMVKITPSQLDSYQRCPRGYQALSHTPYSADATLAQQRGRFVHDLICRHNHLLMRGIAPSVYEVIAATPVPRGYHDGGELEQRLITLAERSLVGYAAVLREEGISQVLGAEAYVRTLPRPLTSLDAAKAQVVFSGRLDVVAVRKDGVPLYIDVKTGPLLAADSLRAMGSTYIYTLLMQFDHGVASSEIMHVAPAEQQTVCVRLTSDELAIGAAACRRLVHDRVADTFSAAPGEHCAWCPIADDCVASRRQADRPAWCVPL